MERTKGFSLIELMVSLVIALVFGIVMTKVLSSVTHQTVVFKDMADISKTSRTSLFLIVRDIANAGYMLNCVGRSCSVILHAPTAQALNHAGYTNCYFSGAATDKPPCPAVTYSASVLTLNYAALSATDPIQVKYSIANNALVRTEIRADTTSVAPPSGDRVASNIVQMAFEFGTDVTSSGTVTYSASLNSAVPMSQLRSIKVALLTQSDFPDKKYTSPDVVSWLGGAYTVPSSQLHYRFKVMQQEVFLPNLTISP